MSLWTGNGAVHKKFQSIAIKGILKLNNSWPELFNFQKSLTRLHYFFQDFQIEM